jgi:hypothetical protein
MRLIAGPSSDLQEAQAMNYLPNLIQISSNSWGPPDDGVSLSKPGPLTLAAFANAAANGRNGKGTIFTWAGGNGGNRNDNSNYDSYANSIYTIAVGAIDSSGNRSFYSEPGANIYSSFFSLHSTGLSSLEFLQGELTDELKLAWKRAYESTQQPIDHQTAKESNVIVNLFAHGQRMYRSLMDSLTENYIFRHLFQNKCSTNPFQLYLFPIPNFNTQIGGTPEIKVQMYFTGVDLCESIAKGYSL